MEDGLRFGFKCRGEKAGRLSEGGAGDGIFRQSSGAGPHLMPWDRRRGRKNTPPTAIRNGRIRKQMPNGCRDTKLSASDSGKSVGDDAGSGLMIVSSPKGSMGHHARTKRMTTFRPKYITFDCHGTLINFQMAEAARDLYGDRLAEPAMQKFIKNFAAYRLDEIMGDWKPYADVVYNSLERSCKANGVSFKDEDARMVYERVPTWGPHADVPAGLAKVAKEIPLVILSNAMDDQIPSNVAKLGAPFHAVYTAQQANAYKPRFQAFEYMFDMLGCGPEDILHCSSSFRYDLMSAHDLGIKNKVWVNRGHEPANPFYGYTEIADISGLPGVVGL
jgi:2-haloacid dehalogenase